MKKILLAQCLTSVALLTGCNLDLEPLDKLADQNYYNNRKELEVFTNGANNTIYRSNGHKNSATERRRMELGTAFKHQHLS